MKSHVTKVIRDLFINVLGPKFIKVVYEHLVSSNKTWSAP
jgi:predicted small integral membrane protein